MTAGLRWWQTYDISILVYYTSDSGVFNTMLSRPGSFLTSVGCPGGLGPVLGVCAALFVHPYFNGTPGNTISLTCTLKTHNHFCAFFVNFFLNSFGDVIWFCPWYCCLHVWWFSYCFLLCLSSCLHLPPMSFTVLYILFLPLPINPVQ